MMKRSLLWVWVLGLIWVSTVYGTGAYDDGAGTAGDPYTIATAEQLDQLGQHPEDWGQHFIQIADIDLAGYDGQDGRPVFHMIGRDSWASDDPDFGGTFDGQGYTISHFTPVQGDAKFIGLFRHCIGTLISNVTLVEPSIHVYCEEGDRLDAVGALVGAALYDSRLINCHVQGGQMVVQGDGNVYDVGGLAGAAGMESHVSQCSCSISIISDYEVGGLMKYLYDSDMADCSFTGQITAGVNSGGLVGSFGGGSDHVISNCHAAGSLTIIEREGMDHYDSFYYVGGLVGGCDWGSEYHFLEDSSSDMEISIVQVPEDIRESLYVGGLVGETSEIRISNCHSAGAISGPCRAAGGLFGGYNNCYWLEDCSSSVDIDVQGIAGGLIGQLVDGFRKIRRCYATGDVQATGPAGGLIGVISDDGGRIEYCWATGDVTGQDYVGGLIGDFSRGEIELRYSFYRGQVAGNTYVGGLIGRAYDCWDPYSGDSLENCYAQGGVSGQDYVGGLIGGMRREDDFDDFHLKRCYAACAMECAGDHVYGLGGWPRANSFWNIDVAGLTTIRSVGGGLTDEMMRQKMRYLERGWDFAGETANGTEDIWTMPIYDGQVQFPRFVWEEPKTVDYVEPFGVDLADWAYFSSHWLLVDYENFDGIEGCDLDGSGVVDRVDLWLFAENWLAGTNQSYYSGGAGTPEDPYQISSASEFIALMADYRRWDEYFLLTADIDFSDYVFGLEDPGYEDYNGFRPIGYDWDHPFTGGFDGGHHTISNYTAYFGEGADITGWGLFGVIEGAQIENLELVDIQIHAPENEDVGGLVGRMDLASSITGCSATGSVQGRFSVGGLVGKNQSGTISRCFSECSVYGTYFKVGGLIGSNEEEGFVDHSYATGQVQGASQSGGLIGLNKNMISSVFPPYYPTVFPVSFCYSAGQVVGEGETIGGLIGVDVEPEPEPWPPQLPRPSFGASYRSVDYAMWDVEASGQLISAGGRGCRTEQMQDPDFLRYWSSEPAIWSLDAGQDYLRLAWENRPGVPLTGSVYSGGSGTQIDPYLIETPEQFFKMMKQGYPSDWDAYFKLTCDLDLGAVGDTDYEKRWFSYLYIPGYSDDGIFAGYQGFYGVFDGDGHVLENYSGPVGVFGSCRDAVIKNLGIVHPHVDQVAYGFAEDDPLNKRYIGVLADYSQDCHVSNCYVLGGQIRGARYAGGLVGSIYHLSYFEPIGSISMATGSTSGSFAATEVIGGTFAGGFAASVVYSSVSDCYSQSDVQCDSTKSGGFVGVAEDSEISNCYSASTITGASAGGMIGYQEDCDFTGLFWDHQIAPQGQSAAGVGLDTAAMQMMETYLDAGWDFVGETANGMEDLWLIEEGADYPMFWWQEE